MKEADQETPKGCAFITYELKESALLGKICYIYTNSLDLINSYKIKFKI
jgi:hypothetical protein